MRNVSAIVSIPAPCSAPPGTSRELSAYLPSDLLSVPTASLDQILADNSIFSFEGHTVPAAPSTVRKQTAKENGRMNKHACI